MHTHPLQGCALCHLYYYRSVPWRTVCVDLRRRWCKQGRSLLLRNKSWQRNLYAISYLHMYITIVILIYRIGCNEVRASGSNGRKQEDREVSKIVSSSSVCFIIFGLIWIWTWTKILLHDCIVSDDSNVSCNYRKLEGLQDEVVQTALTVSDKQKVRAHNKPPYVDEYWHFTGAARCWEWDQEITGSRGWSQE